ncbi:MAG: ACT domain-containing protein [Candidatus Saliniplasma sp.]
MTYYEILKIDEDGKITFPMDCAYDLGLVKDSYFVLEVSPEVKEARLERVALPGKELVELELVLKDKPGTLSTISGILGKHKVNILFNEGEEISSTEAVLIAVIDISQIDTSVEELTEELKAHDRVINISVKDVE